MTHMQIVEAFQSIIMIYLAYLQWRKQDFVFDLGIMAPKTPHGYADYSGLLERD